MEDDCWYCANDADHPDFEMEQERRNEEAKEYASMRWMLIGSVDPAMSVWHEIYLAAARNYARHLPPEPALLAFFR